MKYYLLVLLIILIAKQAAAQDSLMAESKTGNFIVVVVGFEHSEGTARVALSNTEEDWEKRGEAFRGLTSEIIGDSASVTFENIPFGKYGIKIHHDEDDDQEFDTNFLGIPSENYGFSNNASGLFGPADWEDAKFTFESDNQIHEIDLND
jgi:uncharacterized protein (DUF2141 family)